jgi:hypothetical protein
MTVGRRFERESGDEMKYDRDFMKLVHREIWRIAKKLPRLEKALIEAGVPRKFPPKPKDYFVTPKAKPKRRTIH